MIDRFAVRVAFLVLADFSVSSLSSQSKGYKISGAAADDKAGTEVSTGDVDGDGRVEVIVGAPFADPSGRTDAGTAYVIWGNNTAGNR